MTNSSSLKSALNTLTAQFPQHGTLQAVYLRPARGTPCLSVNSATTVSGRGLQGDRATTTPSRNPLGSNRQITLIQAEHIAVIAALLGKHHIDAALLRRNLVVSGINLLAAKSLFRDQPMQITIGNVVLEVTGPCEPCSKMEAALGTGTYNAMRGHGGVNAKVIIGGVVKLGDTVRCIIANTGSKP